MLVTRRLQLREFQLDDDGFIVELLNDPEWLRFIGDRGVRDEAGARRYLESGPLASYAAHGFGLWCVEKRTSGERMGMCGLLRRDSLPDVDVGFAFLPRYRGLGYAREAAEASLEYGFGALRLGRIVAVTSLENLRSRRVLEGLGMRFEEEIEFGPGGERVALFGMSAADLRRRE